MIFQMAGTSAYDKNEVQVYIIAEKGKCLFSEMKEGEWAECIIHNIHSGRIHTISSPL